MRKNKIISFCLWIACLVLACKDGDRSNGKVFQKPCRSDKLIFLCSFDATQVDSVLIAKHASATISGEKNLYKTVIFSKSKEYNSNPVRGSIDVEDSISNNQSFSICLKIGSLSKIYNIENIVIDTMPVYRGYICGLKSYTLDGVVHKEKNFYLRSF